MPFDIDDPEDLMALTLAGRREAKALIVPQLLKARQRQDLIVREAKRVIADYQRRENDLSTRVQQQQRALIKALPETGWLRTYHGLILPISQAEASQAAPEFKMGAGLTGTAFNRAYKSAIGLTGKQVDEGFATINWDDVVVGDLPPKNEVGDRLLHVRAAKAFIEQAPNFGPLLPPMQPGLLMPP